jgi:hypothetical protein
MFRHELGSFREPPEAFGVSLEPSGELLESSSVHLEASGELPESSGVNLETSGGSGETSGEAPEPSQLTPERAFLKGGVFGLWPKHADARTVECLWRFA